MQGEVELPVPSPRKAVSGPVGGGNLDGCDAGVAGERRCGRKTAGMTDSPEQPASDDRSDAVDLTQSAAGDRNRLPNLPTDQLEPLVGGSDLGDQVTGQLLAGRLDGHRPVARRSAAATQRGTSDRSAPTGDQVSQQGMELIDQPGPLGDHIAATLVEQRQHRGQVLGHDRVGVAVQRNDASRGGSVDHVVLASSAADSSRTRAVAVEATSSMLKERHTPDGYGEGGSRFARTQPLTS